MNISAAIKMDAQKKEAHTFSLNVDNMKAVFSVCCEMEKSGTFNDNYCVVTELAEMFDWKKEGADFVSHLALDKSCVEKGLRLSPGDYSEKNSVAFMKFVNVPFVVAECFIEGTSFVNGRWLPFFGDNNIPNGTKDYMFGQKIALYYFLHVWFSTFGEIK